MFRPVRLCHLPNCLKIYLSFSLLCLRLITQVLTYGNRSEYPDDCYSDHEFNKSKTFCFHLVSKKGGDISPAFLLYLYFNLL